MHSVALSLSLFLSSGLCAGLFVALALSLSLSTRQEPQGGPTLKPARERAPAVHRVSDSPPVGVPTRGSAIQGSKEKFPRGVLTGKGGATTSKTANQVRLRPK